MMLFRYHWIRLLILTLFVSGQGAAATVYVSEIMADNGGSLLDEDDDESDWIELYNDSTNAVSLAGWHLTDNAAELTKWTFPAASIPAKGFLVVFASDKNRAVAGQELHTNFKLSASGEYIALVRPDGVTIEDGYSFPAQLKDVSWGYAFSGNATTTTAILVDSGAACTARVPTYSSDATGWKASGFNDSTWQSGTTGVGYERYSGYDTYIGLDVESAMYNRNQSVYIRVPFTYDGSPVSSLRLRMMYDDGFVAYLNGTQIAAANAPTPLLWNSPATGQPGDSQSVVFQDFDVSSYSSALQIGANVLAIHGLNINSGSSDLLFVPLLDSRYIDYSTKTIEPAERGMLDVVTPGLPNGMIYLDLCDTPFVFPERGFYDSALQAAVSNVTDGATVYYTLDGSLPTTNSLLYTGPITISATTNLRVRAFKEGWKPSHPRTDTYIFVNDVILQPESEEVIAGDYATGNGQVMVYGMDQGVVNKPYYDASNQRITVQDALKAIPTISVTTDDDNLYDPARGIYVNATQRWEVPASIELIYPSGTKGFHINAGLRIRGGWSRHDEYCKHAFRLFFRNEYGEATLKYPLFEEEGVDEFKKMDLRTAQNYNWAKDRDHRNTFLRDVFCRDTSGAMGDPYTRSRYYHLYLNGLYWGLYMTEERPVADFAASYFGGDSADYDAIKTTSWTDPIPYTIEATDGTVDAYYRLYAAAMAGFTNNADYFSVMGLDADGEPDPTKEKLLDVENMINYLLIIYYAGASDNGITYFGGYSKINNLFAVYNRKNPDGFKWFQHDGEHSLDTRRDYDLTGPFTHTNFTLPQSFNAQTLHEKLSVNEEYRIKFADQVYKYFYNDGALVQSNCEARLAFRAAQIDHAIVANAARWGSTDLDRDTWLTAVEEVRAFFDNRCQTVIGYLAQDGLIPSIEPPQISHRGGEVDSGTRVGLTAARGTIYYTTNGRDPRAIGGNIAGSRYTDPIAIRAPVKIKARALFPSGEWSALAEATFVTPEVPLAVTELMYHAPSNQLDFIEIRNVSAEPVSLYGYKIDGAIDFKFAAGSVLDPGGYLVVIKDIDSFSAVYNTNGIAIAGEYKGDFNNSGEKVQLEFHGYDLISFEYSDARNWPQAADGSGHSIVPLESAMDNQAHGSLDYGGNWRASTYIGGSPGYADPIPQPTVMLNEITAHTDTGLAPPFDSNDKIELYNPTASPITLNGWYLSDSLGTPHKWAIPDGTVIPAFGFLLFDEDDFHPDRVTGFGLNKAGEQVVLSSPNGVVDAIRFKGQENGVSLGRYPDGSSHWLTTIPTPGSANQPVPESIWIAELMYNPPAPVGHLNGDAVEYIQLENRSGSSVLFETVAGSWRIDGGVSYTFPTGFSLPAGDRLWLVSFDPEDTALLSLFCTTYGLNAAQEIILGPYKGELSNRGERVALERPQDSDDPLAPLDISWVVVDELFYFDRAPWPASADGGGHALIRTGLTSWDVTFTPGIAVSETSIHNRAFIGQVPIESSFRVWNSACSTLNYSITSNVPWLSVSPSSGSSTDEQDPVTLTYNATGLTAGSYTGQVTIAAAGALNTPRSVDVVLELYEQTLDHFLWESIGAEQWVDQPFNVSLSARDQHGSLISSFTDSVSVSGLIGGIPPSNIDLGLGTSQWNFPLSTSQHDARTQSIYLKTEIGGACRITSLALNVKSVPGQMLGNWTIRLRHTPLNSYGSPPIWESTWTTVYQKNTTISSSGWVVFEFDAPFEYNGTDNLMVDFSYNNSSFTQDGICLATDTRAYRSAHYRTNGGFGNNPLSWTGSSNPTPSRNTRVPILRLGCLIDNSIVITPAVTGNFTDGIWSGMISVHEGASDVVLSATGGGSYMGESNPFDAVVNPDADGDGLPDAWEAAFFGHATNCIATDDADNDGQTNWQEYIAGTNPTNAASRFAAVLDAQSSDEFIVRWDPVTNRTYDVLWSPDLMQPFRILEPAIPYPVNSYTHRVHSASAAGFYIVRVRLPSGTDFDGDGLPDLWESEFFGHPVNAMAGDDADGDGQSNFEEYLAGTDPTNAASRFEINAISSSSLQWNAEAGRTYSVYWTDDLNKPFARIASGLEQGSYSNSLHSADSSSYYYITVERE